MATPARYNPKQNNNRHLVIIKSSSHSTGTYTRKSITDFGYGEKVKLDLHKGHPDDKVKLVSESYVQPSGTVDNINS